MSVGGRDGPPRCPNCGEGWGYHRDDCPSRAKP